MRYLNGRKVKVIMKEPFWNRGKPSHPQIAGAVLIANIGT